MFDKDPLNMAAIKALPSITKLAKPEREPMKRRAGDPDRMNLPEGKTCSDCFHFERCNAMFGHIAADEQCDWSPSRFALPKPPQELAPITKLARQMQAESALALPGQPLCIGVDMATAPHRTVYVLMWGGGDDPENPAITVNFTRDGAIARACRLMDGLVSEAEVERMERELRATGECDGIGGADRFMRIEEADIEP